jgi:nucleotide-binding universal stress UspA family protein
VRVLAVVNVLRASFTSLLPVAARRYQAACADWQRLEGERLQRLLDDLTPLLPAAADVVWARSTGAELDRAIAEHAAGWSADVILIGAAPAAGPWLGAVHERLIRHAPCPVLVTPVAAPPRRTARVRSLEPARGQRVGLVTGREA